MQSSASQRLFFIVVLGVTAVTILFGVFSPSRKKAPMTGDKRPHPHLQHSNKGDIEVKPDKKTRMPVAGSPGYWIVMGEDGASFLEEPGGRLLQLTGPTAADVLTPDVIDKIVADQLKAVKPPAEATQLLVLDQGVVTVPLNAVITFQGKDRAVVMRSDGSSAVYYVNGKIEEHHLRPRPTTTAKKGKT